MNLFAYANNNSINYIDSLGLYYQFTKDETEMLDARGGIFLNCDCSKIDTYRELSNKPMPSSSLSNFISDYWGKYQPHSLAGISSIVTLLDTFRGKIGGPIVDRIFGAIQVGSASYSSMIYYQAWSEWMMLGSVRNLAKSCLKHCENNPCGRNGEELILHNPFE